MMLLHWCIVSSVEYESLHYQSMSDMPGYENSFAMFIQFAKQHSPDKAHIGIHFHQ